MSKEKKNSTKEESKKLKKKKVSPNSINANKSAQMIFKTALRNHIDLTSIADNKSNIMLSINALIITISIPFLVSMMETNFLVIIPSSILLISCLVSIIYATLATRPIATKGVTSLKEISERPTNLFFFGNFHAMNYPDYKIGIKAVMEDDNKLDDSITTDLFYLGKALGKKFKLLRICYTVFMVGMILTVIAFMVFIFLSNAQMS